MDLDEVYDTSSATTAIRKKFRRKFQSGTYVLKMLRSDLPVEEHVKGVTDLAIEAEFLQVLQHDNIIAMRAVANTDPRENRYFVILDRLSMTLEKKFNYWRTAVGQSTGPWIPCCGYCMAKSAELHAVWKERIRSARDVARAVQYLHKHKIIYRDLKPDNLGYDAATGSQIKLFDFGLAKRLEGMEPDAQTGTFMLTGNTGSLRYMAPEVALDQPYSYSVDAYSFSILFWQICSLQTPFAGMSQKAHAEKVVGQGQRPKLDRTWPASWVELIKSSWNQDAQARPNFDAIVGNLEDRMNELEEDDGVIPSRASEIRAKRRRKKPTKKDTALDTDTRLAVNKSGKRVDAEIV